MTNCQRVSRICTAPGSVRHRSAKFPVFVFTGLNRRIARVLAERLRRRSHISPPPHSLIILPSAPIPSLHSGIELPPSASPLPSGDSLRRYARCIRGLFLILPVQSPPL